MRLYLAREALDPHLRLAGGAMDSRLSSAHACSLRSRRGFIIPSGIPAVPAQPGHLAKWNQPEDPKSPSLCGTDIPPAFPFPLSCDGPARSRP